MFLSCAMALILSKKPMVLKLSKKVHLLAILCWSQSIKGIYIYTSRGLVIHFQKRVLFIMPWLTVSEILCMKSTNILKFLLSQHLFDILIANISWTVAQNPINHIIFCKSVMRPFRCIYVNCFNKFRFLAEVSTKLQEIHFFGQFKDLNSGRKHED